MTKLWPWVRGPVFGPPCSYCRIIAEDSPYTETKRQLITVAEQPSVNKNFIAACNSWFKISTFRRITYNDVTTTSYTWKLLSFFKKFITNYYFIILTQELMLTILLIKVGCCKPFWSPLVYYYLFHVICNGFIKMHSLVFLDMNI